MSIEKLTAHPEKEVEPLVLYVGDGKGIATLDGALKILKKSKIQAVAMDMSNAYSSWFQTHFPDVKIVFDHFHLIKSMNEKVDAVRRRVTAKLDDTQRGQFKGLRFIFPRNHEDLCEDAKSILRISGISIENFLMYICLRRH